MFINPFENAQTELLRRFSEEYIRLAELIMFFDKEDWDMIDSAENSTKTKMIMGEETAFSDEKAATTHFMRLRVSLIEKNIKENTGVMQAQYRISSFLKEHQYEVGILGLSFRSKKLLTPAEIYANYYYLVQKLKDLVIKEPYRKKNK